jgi:hypothetical protein
MFDTAPVLDVNNYAGSMIPWARTSSSSRYLINQWMWTFEDDMGKMQSTLSVPEILERTRQMDIYPRISGPLDISPGAFPH